MAEIKTLKAKETDGTEFDVYPRTVLGAITDTSTNNTLDNIISDINTNVVKVYSAVGKIVNSIFETSVEGIGIAIVQLYKNNIAKIDFSFKLTNVGTLNTIGWGLSPYLLNSINENIPIITPINNTGIFMSIEGTNINIDDYGNTLLAYSTRWNPAKITTVDGNVEYISSGNYTSNTIFVGTAFGTY